MEKAVNIFLEQVEKDGAVPDEVPKVAPGPLKEIHAKSLEEQNEIWENYKETFDGINNKYLEDVLVQAANLITNGDSEGADLLTREHAATKADENRMHKILQGQSPAVPEAGAGGDEEEDE